MGAHTETFLVFETGDLRSIYRWFNGRFTLVPSTPIRMKRCYLFTTCVSLLYYTPLFSQSNPSYLLKVNITDSIRHLLEHELLDRCHIEHQVCFNEGTYDMETAVTARAAQTAPSLSNIKRQKKKLCH